jgi:hypothetical protein
MTLHDSIRGSLLFAAVLMTAQWSPGALGQDFVFPGKPKPAAILNASMVPSARPILELYRDVGDKPLRCYIVAEGTEARREPSATGRVMRQLGFLEDRRLFVAAYHPAPDRGQGTEFWFLVEAFDDNNNDSPKIKDYVGWVRRGDCLGFVGGSVEGLKDPDEHLHRKAMLRNVLNSARDSQALRAPLPFLDRPDTGGRERLHRSLFQIYYIYMEFNNYVLLGRAPRGTGDPPRESILGWIPRAHICPWNTREAIEFNKADAAIRTRRARVFLQRADLEAYLNLEDREAVAEEENLLDPPLSYFQPRYPVISDADRRYQGMPIAGTHIYKIGVIGDVVDVGPDKRRIPVAEIARQRELAKSAKTRAETIQISFIIDATFSMDRWFVVATEAIKQIMGETQNLNETEVQPKVFFSMNFYRDKGDGPELQLETNPFDSAAAAVQILQKQVAIGGRRPREDVFYAIRESIKRHPFQPDAVKILILIGDDGNDPRDTAHSVQTVSQDLVQVGGTFPIAFFAVGVGEGDDEGQKLFMAQSSAIARALSDHQSRQLTNALGPNEPMTPELRQAIETLSGHPLVSNQPEQIIAGIQSRFQLAVAEMRFRSKVLGDLIGGTRRAEPARTEGGNGNDRDRVPRTYGVIWKQQMQQLIRDQGLAPLELAKDGVQLFTEGWIAETDPYELMPKGASERPKAIQHVAFLHKMDLYKLKIVLDKVLDTWNPRTVEKSWKEALDIVTGGDVKISSDQSPMQLSQMYLGIKVKNHLLAHTFRELLDMDAGAQSRLRRELQLKAEQLNDVLEDREAFYKPTNELGADRKPIVRRTKAVPRNYWFWDEESDQNDGGEKRAWVEREKLP